MGTVLNELTGFDYFICFSFIKINQLNDSHAQLMVHWLGEGTNVMLCLAREPPPAPSEEVKPTNNPSAVYISYNNGDTFEDKTYLFQLNDTTTGKMFNSSLDQFTTHPTYNTVSIKRNDSFLSASILLNLKEIHNRKKVPMMKCIQCQFPGSNAWWLFIGYSKFFRDRWIIFE